MGTYNTATLFLCENFIVDVKNTVSLINIFTGITIGKFPATHSSIVYFHVTGIEGKHSVRVTITSPEGQEVEVVSNTINVAKKRDLLHLADNLDYTYESEGVYIFNAFLDNEHVSELYIDVIKTDS